LIFCLEVQHYVRSVLQMKHLSPLNLKQVFSLPPASSVIVKGALSPKLFGFPTVRFHHPTSAKLT
jgi:hypothetical protein